MANRRSASSLDNLRVITDSDRARELAAKSAEVRRQRSEARKLAAARQTVAEFGGRSGLGERCFAAASVVVDDILAGRIPIRTAREAASVISALVTVGRTEAPPAEQPKTREELIADIKALKEAARQQMGTSA